MNYIRSEVKNGNKNPDVSDAAKFADDKYLQPVLEDDAVLFSLDELSADDEEPQSEEAKKVKELEEQLQQLASQFAEYRETVSKTLEERWNEKDTPKEGEAGPSGSSKAPEGKWGIDTGYFDSYSYNGKLHKIVDRRMP